MRIFLNKDNYIISFIMLLCLLLPNKIVIADEAESLYQSGLRLFDIEDFENSIEKLEDAVELKPDVVKYHHILAKSYGRLAEQSGWLRAIKLAKKTLKHLELAAELDKKEKDQKGGPLNILILSDLRNYYQKAPIFLGGSGKKAIKISERIKRELIKYDSYKQLEQPPSIEQNPSRSFLENPTCTNDGRPC